MPGCLEHPGVVTQLIQETRKSKGDLAIIWLDLANAYGFILVALTRHNVPGKICNLIMDYYNDFCARVSISQLTARHSLEKGMITSCIISVSVFSLSRNMPVKSAGLESRGPKSRSGTRQPPIKACNGRPDSDNHIRYLLLNICSKKKQKSGGLSFKRCKPPIPE